MFNLILLVSKGKTKDIEMPCQFYATGVSAQLISESKVGIGCGWSGWGLVAGNTSLNETHRIPFLKELTFQRQGHYSHTAVLASNFFFLVPTRLPHNNTPSEYGQKLDPRICCRKLINTGL